MRTSPSLSAPVSVSVLKALLITTLLSSAFVFTACDDDDDADPSDPASQVVLQNEVSATDDQGVQYTVGFDQV